MEQTTYASRLRYLDAEDLDDSFVNFDALDVQGNDGTKLGDVDGFLVDPAAGRVLYTVVDSGGWFTSRRFLVPIGHASVDRDASVLRVDVTRDTLRNYPEFDESRFREFSDDDLKTYEHRLAAACCPEDARNTATWTREGDRHYAQPDWWKPDAYRPERLRPVETRPYRTRTTATATAAGAGAPREAFDREHVTARDRGAHDDTSPHYGGRAQPGDVLGIETAGETTSVGDTAEDEDTRRRDAEKAARDDRRS